MSGFKDGGGVIVPGYLQFTAAYSQINIPTILSLLKGIKFSKSFSKLSFQSFLLVPIIKYQAIEARCL
jgi:hypothetical protein